MSGRRWSLWLGLPIALVAIALLIGRLQLGRRACGGVERAGGRLRRQPANGRRSGGVRTVSGTWWRLVDRLDGSGSLVGRTLSVGSGRIGRRLTARARRGEHRQRAGRWARRRCARRRTVFRSAHRLGRRRLLVARPPELRTSCGVPSSTPLTARCSRTSCARGTRDDLGTWRIVGVDPGATLARWSSGRFRPSRPSGRSGRPTLRLD